MNIPMLADRASAVSIVAAAAGADARSLLSTYTLWSCKFFFGEICNQLVQGIASGVLHLSSSATEEVPCRQNPWLEGTTGSYA